MSRIVSCKQVVTRRGNFKTGFMNREPSSSCRGGGHSFAGIMFPTIQTAGTTAIPTLVLLPICFCPPITTGVTKKRFNMDCSSCTPSDERHRCQWIKTKRRSHFFLPLVGYLKKDCEMIESFNRLTTEAQQSKGKHEPINPKCFTLP